MKNERIQFCVSFPGFYCFVSNILLGARRGTLDKYNSPCAWQPDPQPQNLNLASAAHHTSLEYQSCERLNLMLYLLLISPQGDSDGRGKQTASPTLTAIMSDGVGISGRELSTQLNNSQEQANHSFSQPASQPQPELAVSMGAGPHTSCEHGGRAPL